MPCTLTAASSISTYTSTSPLPAAACTLSAASNEACSFMRRPWRPSAVIRLLRGSYDRPMPAICRAWGTFAASASGGVIFMRITADTERYTSRKRPGALHSEKYLKRPPMPASQLRHYCGGAVDHHYLDRRTGKHKRQMLSHEEVIGRYINHVPARYFMEVCYSGLLANRKSRKLLTGVYQAL